MSRILLGLCVTLILWDGHAMADMIEVRNKGFMNGTILSDDGKELKFKDAKGKEHLYKRTDVLFLEKEDPGKAMKQNTTKVLDAIKQAPAAVKKQSQKLTEQFIAPMSQPLDRSAADAKSAALNSALEEANRAAAASTKKVVTFNKEVYRQQSEAGDSLPGESDKKKGHFSSLDS